MGLVAGTLSRSRAIMVLRPLNIVVLVAILVAALIGGLHDGTGVVGCRRRPADGLVLLAFVLAMLLLIFIFA